MIAMALAPRAPERVEALILACTSPAMDPSTWDQRLALIRAEGLGAIVEGCWALLLQRLPRAAPDVIDTVRAGILAQSPDGYCGCGAAIRDMALLDRLSGHRRPDPGAHRRAGRRNAVRRPWDRIVAAISGARHAVVEGAHLPSLEAPAAFAGAIRGFLAEVLHGTAIQDAKDTLFEAGLATRRKVLGDTWVTSRWPAVRSSRPTIRR
jgi:3-oxoadipate enol-lactonase/4-carboxymuconolactone decarboxylase